jgi:hypothetical protein
MVRASVRMLEKMVEWGQANDFNGGREKCTVNPVS